MNSIACGRELVVVSFHKFIRFKMEITNPDIYHSFVYVYLCYIHIASTLYNLIQHTFPDYQTQRALGIKTQLTVMIIEFVPCIKSAKLLQIVLENFVNKTFCMLVKWI